MHVPQCEGLLHGITPYSTLQPDEAVTSLTRGDNCLVTMQLMQVTSVWFYQSGSINLIPN